MMDPEAEKIPCNGFRLSGPAPKSINIIFIAT